MRAAIRMLVPDAKLQRVRFPAPVQVRLNFFDKHIKDHLYYDLSLIISVAWNFIGLSLRVKHSELQGPASLVKLKKIYHSDALYLKSKMYYYGTQ